MAGAAGRRLLVGLVLLLGAGFLTAPLATAAPACPAVALFAVAGTNETSEAADPARSVGLLAGLTDPLARRWGDDLSVRYVPYPASLDRPVFYPFSEGRGAERLARDAGDLAARCPDTTITLVGFSQGADVVSDVVHRAANGTIALPADRIAGAVMLGSPRRDPRAPNLLDTPGRGVLGPRPTRELDVYDGRVYEVCAPGRPDLRHREPRRHRLPRRLGLRRAPLVPDGGDRRRAPVHRARTGDGRHRGARHDGPGELSAPVRSRGDATCLSCSAASCPCSR